MSEKFYAERDIIGMDSKGGHYYRHISAMTREGLHSKSDIAAELGFRDMVIAELEDKCAALAAENAALKSAIQTHSESVHFCELCGKDDPCSTDDVCMVLNETPATDAYLAEVRAQGADAVADQHRRKYEELKTINVFFAKDHRDAQKVAEFVAVQLRQEAAQ